MVSVGPVFLRNSIFRKNSAKLDGGAIYVNGFGQFFVSNTLFTNNSAVRVGGALSSEGTAVMNVDSSNFTYNSANQGASGFFAGKTTVTLSKSLFTNNFVSNVIL